MKSLFRKTSAAKIFCIGQNKTGTTTVESVFKSFGYTLGNQIKGELLFKAWQEGNFKEIIEFCKTAEAFQDVPFSLPNTYQHLDEAYPDAKFILTERDSAEQWYQSLTRFHSKKWSDGKRIPTVEDLTNATYRYKGYAYQFMKNIYHTQDSDLYNKTALISHYNNYNEQVKTYFKEQPEKLLIINVSNSSDYGNLCSFLKQTPQGDNFPWKNKT
ncbi:sulfotransferase [Psychroserpens sp. SPM9]|uniref:sulfotransferase n=1 Tax=Psychroserpens sp. SPM9 TaxID=2975598 RepID=UPI0021A8D378|nr:sulfotransferase [Psychroserpens sp. SPM9]MDG5492252.1 sulfotransferase [Psychroserpens sp. SPM9]